jgi:hypothetical protein
MEQPTKATQLPGNFSYGHLRLDPYWDRLRRDPRFEKLMASLAAGSKETVGLNSTNPKADVADGFSAKALLQFS